MSDFWIRVLGFFSFTALKETSLGIMGFVKGRKRQSSHPASLPELSQHFASDFWLYLKANAPGPEGFTLTRSERDEIDEWTKHMDERIQLRVLRCNIIETLDNSADTHRLLGRLNDCRRFYRVPHLEDCESAHDNLLPLLAAVTRLLKSGTCEIRVLRMARSVAADIEEELSRPH